METARRSFRSLVAKKLFTLEGKIVTPIISFTPFLKKLGCWITIVGDLTTNKRPRRTYVGKLVKGERKAPTMLRAYRGYVKITYVNQSETQAKKRLKRFLSMDSLGSKGNSGYGKIKWLNWKVEPFQRQKAEHKRKKLRIRKGLGPTYPKELQRLLIALMLHDFVHTKKHQSKIYQEINIEDEEIREACLNHHNQEESENNLLPFVKYYDKVAAYISRQKPYKKDARYDYENGKLDFNLIVNEIEQRQQSAYKLYNYIYQSNELNRIVEAMAFSNKSLRNHLLLMVNLAINSYYNGWLKTENKKLVLKRKSSTSVDEREEKLNTTKDAEKHLSLSMNKKKSLGNSLQVNDEKNVISKEKSTTTIKKSMEGTNHSSSSPASR